MHPDGDDLVSHGTLGLGDLVLVVREVQVVPPRVDVEAVAQVLHGHRRALDVPAGEALSPGRVGHSIGGPGRRTSRGRSRRGGASEGRSPARGAPRAACPGCSPRAGRSRERRDVVVDAPRIHDVGVARFDERLRKVDHLRDVLGRLGDSRRSGCRRRRRPRRTPACTSGRSRGGASPSSSTARSILSTASGEDFVGHVAHVGDVHDESDRKPSSSRPRRMRSDEHVRPEVAEMGVR